MELYDVAQACILSLDKHIVKAKLSDICFIKRSPLYRIYNAFLKNTRPLNEFDSDRRFAKYLKEGENINQKFYTFLVEIVSDVTRDNQYPYMVKEENEAGTDFSDEANCNLCKLHGWILRNDLKCAAEFLALQVKPYTVALIKGTTFRGRGSDCSETEFPKCELRATRYGQVPLTTNPNIFRPRKEANNLGSNWNDKRHLSSWCKCQVGGITSKEEFFGHINYFFKLSLRSDPILKEFLLVSLTTRVSSFPKKGITLSIINVQDKEIKKLRMVAFADVYSSPICFIPCHMMHDSNLVLRKDREDRHLSKEIQKDLKKHFCADDFTPSDLNTLIMLPLYPHRLNLI
jgi:hypothetical protein